MNTYVNEMSEIDENQSFVALKGKIKTARENLHGIFVIIVNLREQSLESASLVFSIYSESHGIHFSEGWHVFEKKIQDMVYGGKSAEAVTFATQDAMRMYYKNREHAKELIEYIEKNNKIFVTSMLEEFFDKELSDPNIQLDIDIERISASQLASGRQREESAGASQEEQRGDEPKLAMARAKLVLAPVGGKLVTEVRAGDQIMIRLIPGGVRENVIIESLELKKSNGDISPCACKVIKVTPLSKGVQIMVQIDDQTIAKIEEEEKVLVKMFNPLKDLTASIRNSGPAPSAPKPELAAKNGRSAKEKTPKGKSPVLMISMLVMALLVLAIAYMLLTS